MKKWIYLFFFITITSCDNNSNRIRENLAKMQSSRIDPSTNGMVRLDPLIGYSKYNGQRKYNFIMFVDSDKCSPCILGTLIEWEEYLDSLNVCSNVGLITIINSPSNNQHAKRTILERQKELRLPFPIYLDTASVFLRHNSQFPRYELVMNTFLIDSDGSVLVVGNPVNNATIAKLVEKIVNEGSGRSNV